MAPKYQFVNYTDCPADESKASLATVRKHVMDDYCRRQRQLTRTSFDARKPKRQSKAQQSMTRNSGVPPEGASVKVEEMEPGEHTESKLKRDTTPSVRNASCSTVSRRGNTGRTRMRDASRTKTRQRNDPLELVLNFENVTPPPVLSVHEIDKQSPSTIPTPVIGQLRGCDFDPFSALPVNGSYVNEMIRWHFDWPESQPNFWERSVPCLSVSTYFYKRNFWNMTYDSEGLFHVFLCLAEAKKASCTGIQDHAAVAYLLHKGKAIQAIRAGLAQDDLPADEKKHSTASNVEAIVSLVTNFAGLSLGEDGVEASRLHMNVAAQMIEKKSMGLMMFSDGHCRSIIWNDLRIAAAAFSSPVLPYSPMASGADPPEDLLIECKRLAALTMTVFPKLDPFGKEGTLRSLFVRLHQVTLVYSMEGAPNPAQCQLHTNALYWLMYNLCVLTERSCRTNSGTMRRRGIDAAEVMALCLQLYAWECVPSQIHVKIQMPPHTNLVERQMHQRLCQGLHRLSKDGELIDFWRVEAGARLESLFWILLVLLVIAPTANPDDTEVYDWASTELNNIATVLGLRNMHDAEQVLRLFPWCSRFSPHAMRTVWNGIQTVRRRSTPEQIQDYEDHLFPTPST